MARLGREAQSQELAHRISEAIGTLAESLALERQVHGQVHDDVGDTLAWTARLLERAGDLAAAERNLEEVLAIRRKLHGEDHWRTADARRALLHLEQRKRLPAADQDRLDKAADLRCQALRHMLAGEYADALAPAEECAAIHEAVLGTKHVIYATSLVELAWFHLRLGALAKAEPFYRKALEIQETVLGEAHPDCARSLHDLGVLLIQKQQFEEAARLLQRAADIRRATRGEGSLDYASSILELGLAQYRMGAYGKARPLVLRAVQIRREAGGETDPEYLRGLNQLAALHMAEGEHEKAAALLRRALELQRHSGRPEDSALLNNLAVVCFWLGEYAEAKALLLQALEIRRKTLGEQHPDYAATLNTLGTLHVALGEYARAEALLRQSVEIARRTRGERDLSYATSLSNLASLHQAMGAFAEAEKLLLQVAEIRKEVLGEEHPDYAQTLNNLGGLNIERGEYARAEPLLERAREIQQRTLSRAHPDALHVLNNLAVVHLARGAPEKAEPLLREVLEALPTSIGKENREYMLAVGNLAVVHSQRRQWATAEDLLLQALGLAEKLFGTEHPEYAQKLVSLGGVHDGKGDFARAVATYQRALAIDRRLLVTSAAVQSERQQLEMVGLFRITLDRLLFSASRNASSAADAFAAALPWKGAVFLRQAGMRATARQPELAALFEEWSGTASRLAKLSLDSPAAGRRAAWMERIEQLRGRMEDLEKELARKSADFRSMREARSLTPLELQAALPADAALVDFHECVHEAPGKTHRHFLAFVLKHQGPVVQLDLGVADPIEKAIESWRQSRGLREGDRLRRLLWEPLVPHLAGVGTVLLSPDGALGRLSFAGLPGKKAGNYLLEEVSLAVVPVPQMLPQLLASDASSGKEASLLLVGDVDYGAPAGPLGEGGRAAARRSLPGFERLSATRGEILAIRDSFEQRHADGDVTVLRRAEATESAFRAQANRHRWLHVATHGFFAPESLLSALAPRKTDPLVMRGKASGPGFHPGLLSGLALAGANTPPGEQEDDGILTALEVAALDLSNVEVAVLSACETGLGKAAAGEGILGLQRAFQVAGAGSTVTSLWRVPDTATAQLMQRFYENLWEKNMGKLAALREAQLWLMREGGRRGISIPKDESDSADAKRLPPYYWAAFVLSGDWR